MTDLQVWGMEIHTSPLDVPGRVLTVENVQFLNKLDPANPVVVPVDKADFTKGLRGTNAFYYFL